MIHLHRHSDDSLLDGAGTAFQFAEVAARFGQPALAQTDHGNVNGALKHIKACEEVGIMPICGVEAYWRPDRYVREKEWRYRRWHLILLAKNLTGWHNLLRITSEAFATGFYQNPCVDTELLRKYGEGLMCSAACMLGPVCFLIENGTDAMVDEFIGDMRSIFKDDFWFELMPHDWDRQRAMNIELVSRANQHGVGYYASIDAHYPYPEWANTQSIVTLISTNTTRAEAQAANQERLARGDEVYELGHEGLHLMAEEEVRERFSRFHPDLGANVVERAIKTTHDIAGRVDPFLMDRSLKMPRVTSSIEEAERIVRGWVDDGLRRVGKKGDPTYEKQAEYECEVLKVKGVFDYFVLVGDLVRWAKSSDPLPPSPEDPFPAPKKPIRVGSGRGSAAGSLVSYCCGITTIDPIAHKLKFERFLNPHRKGLPDIDIDFQDDRRDEVKVYLTRKYGREAVADVVSYSTFQPRAALQRVAKTVYGYESDAYQQLVGNKAKRVEGITDRIDPVHHSNLIELRSTIEGLDQWAQDFPEAWLHAVRLENEGHPLIERMSKHPGGVVITPGRVTDYMATVRAGEEEIGFRTAWSETPRLSICDDFGFVKIDVLSIAGMTQQQMAVDSIRARTGIEIDLDALPPLRDPYDVDPRVMEAFQRGLTLGVNQFEGDHITTFLRQMKPENAVDLAAANALYRPGPIGSGGPWTYARRKNGEESYAVHELLQGVVGDTYGVLSFQEQVMDVFSALAGYDAGQADGVRKIIAKLYRDKGDLALRKLEEQKAALFEGAIPLVGEAYAEQLWAEILPYSGYSFNRAHAAGYSIQGYQDMWLKVYYPLDFYAALLTLEPKKAMRAAREARHFDVSLLPPDINTSEIGFTVDFNAHALRYGLGGISGIGPSSAEQIMALRPFASIEDFQQRNSIKYSKCNKGHQRKLLNAGALDSLGGRSDWDAMTKAQHEQELLGMSLTEGGTLGEYEPIVRDSVHTEEEFETLATGDRVVVGGVISEVKTTKVRRGKQAGQPMCFIRISLGLDSWSGTCFPAIYAANVDRIYEGSKVMINGRKDDRGSIVVNAMMGVEEFVMEVDPSAAQTTQQPVMA